LPVRKSRIIYVRQPKELNLNATLDRESYRPGEKAVVKFRVTDPDGAASPGAISVAMVDEAVFHAGSTSGEVMEHVFFLLENELLEPVFQLYDWSPAATWGETPFVARRRFEQALFARTASASFGRNAETWRGSRRAQRVDRMQGVRLSSSPHSNVETSYPAKRRQVARDRRDGLKSSQVAWSSLLGCWILIGMGVFAYRFPRISLAIVGASCAGSMVIAPLLFLLQKADIMPTSGARDAMAAGGEMPTAMPTEDPFAEPSDSVGGKAAEPLRVREFFPETLVWRPELVTNEQGEAELEVDLADSITSWRLSASAVTEQGNLGASRLDVPVFQPFFVDTDLPIALTRDDEIAVPIVVYNYLDTPQEVQLTLKADSWFELLEDSNERSVALQPGEVRSTSMRIRALEVGRHSFEIAARGQDGGDAVRRTIDVAPDGYRHEFLQSGVASRLVEWESRVPDEIVPGSLQTTLKLYPSPLADLAEGMESIFRMPSGCFEQTSTTTYPNVLALTYLRKTNQNAPQIEARARQFIHVGYQRLLTFESPGGGFDWYGGGPGNASLTAYGLMEFEDMAQVYDVDPRLIERTRRWLLAQRQRDGSWQAEGRRFRGVRQAADADYVSTAYVAWSAFRNGAARREAAATADYLLRRRPEDFNSPYTLALALHGLLAVQEDGQELNPYFDRLAEIAVRGEGADAGKAWWAQESDQTTIFYGEDRSADVETTALALLALQKTNRNPQLVQDGMLWLTTQKDARGTWHSTQATILALKALLWQPPNAQSAGEPLVVNVTLEGEIVESIEIQADQIDVVQLVDLTKHRAANRARWGVSAPDGSVRYQFVSEYYDSTPEDAPQDALKVDVTYEKRQAKVGDIVQATAVIENRTNRVAPMVILDLPIPAGFEIDSSTFRDLVTEKLIDKYEMTARKVIVYIRGIEAGSRLQIPYHLRARMSARVKAPGVEAFRYYDPERRGRSAAVELNVTET
jgi:uncharacterized protein YfaS (alpha-2-macroglobulin family)